MNKGSKIRRMGLFRDKNGEVVLGESPNAPLVVGTITAFPAVLLHGKLQLAATVIALGAFGVWAVLEMISGRTLFRRLLGVITLLALIGGLILIALF